MRCTLCRALCALPDSAESAHNSRRLAVAPPDRLRMAHYGRPASTLHLLPVTIRRPGRAHKEGGWDVRRSVQRKDRRGCVGERDQATSSHEFYEPQRMKLHTATFGGLHGRRARTDEESHMQLPLTAAALPRRAKLGAGEGALGRRWEYFGGRDVAQDGRLDTINPHRARRVRSNRRRSLGRPCRLGRNDAGADERAGQPATELRRGRSGWDRRTKHASISALA